jgi:streptogramin lyase
VGGRPLDIAAGDDGVWVTSFTDGTVTRLDLRTGAVQGEPIKVGRQPRGVAVGEGSVWVRERR